VRPGGRLDDFSAHAPDDPEDNDDLVADGEPLTGGWSETLVRRAISSDVPQMAAVLGRAMEEDPGICWMFPRARTRPRVPPQVFAAALETMPHTTGPLPEMGHSALSPPC